MKKIADTMIEEAQGPKISALNKYSQAESMTRKLDAGSTLYFAKKSA